MDWREQRRRGFLFFCFFFALPSAVELVTVYIWSCHRRDAQVGSIGGATGGGIYICIYIYLKIKTGTVNHKEKNLIKRDGLFVLL